MLPNISDGFFSRARWAAALAAVAAATLVGVRPAQAAAPNPLAFSPAFRCTADADAATTIPGWVTVSGSPSLRCANSLHALWPGERPPRVVISSGPYGASALVRVIPLRARTGAHGRITLSAWLAASGRRPARGLLRAEFLGGSGKPLGPAMTLSGPPATAHQGPLRFTEQHIIRDIPPQAVALQLHLALAGSTFHARSYVAALRLTVDPPMALPAPSPPVARVPRFDHVFLIMMENTDYAQLMGDVRDAPFMNSLAARGVVLANYQAIYHPSDENYLAIAGGDAFVSHGIYYPNIHVAAGNLGDRLEAAGKSWREYEEGMGTPCNTSTRYDRNYEPDDAPFILFTDIQSNPGRCRDHLVDVHQWPQDLKQVDTTPAFAWLAADDYDDGEMPGNGSPKSLQVQDAWLRATLAPLFDSPAWREQRTLLILTWDESDTTANNHIPTIVLGSRHTVKSGYVSAIRYDHYSTARTIEAALGLPAMTSNDAYARSFDDAFVGR
jgi:hypothetical protein